ncbi:MAG: helix-turn-helix transcriptional regulator [Croceimicrobium sp.]
MTKALNQLEALIRESQQITILYSSSQGILSERKLNPLALIYTIEGWTLLAYCHLRKAQREFRLERIKEIRELDQFFPPSSTALYRYYQTEGKSDKS